MNFVSASLFLLSSGRTMHANMRSRSGPGGMNPAGDDMHSGVSSEGDTDMSTPLACSSLEHEGSRVATVVEHSQILGCIVGHGVQQNTSFTITGAADNERMRTISTAGSCASAS